MESYENKLKLAKVNLEYYKSMSLENKDYERIVDIAEYMMERVEFHKIQYDRYDDEETRHHINLLFKDIHSLFNVSRFY